MRGTELSTKLVTWRKLTELTDPYCRDNRFSTLPCQRDYRGDQKPKKIDPPPEKDKSEEKGANVADGSKKAAKVIMT